MEANYRNVHIIKDIIDNKTGKSTFTTIDDAVVVNAYKDYDKICIELDKNINGCQHYTLYNDYIIDDDESRTIFKYSYRTDSVYLITLIMYKK